MESLIERILSGLITSNENIAEKEWVKGATEGEKRETAMTRIKKASQDDHTHLTLHGLGLTTLPTAITQCNKLHTLFLSGNNFKTLPDEVYRLTELRHIVLRNNSITELPDQIRHLPRLQFLNCSSNALRVVSPEVGNLPELETLLLHDNNLTTIPDSLLNRNVGLKLDIGKNPISTVTASRIQSTIINNGVIVKLTISEPDKNQDIKELREDLLEWKKGAKDGENRLGAMTNMMKCFTYNLPRLSLVNLGLQELPDALWRLAHLTHLSVRNNNLTILPKEIKQLTLLKSLNISDNSLSSLPDEMTDLTSLQDLSLHDNQLNNLPDAFVTKNKRYYTLSIDIQNNPMTFEEVKKIRDKLPPTITLLSNTKYKKIDPILDELKESRLC